MISTGFMPYVKENRVAVVTLVVVVFSLSFYVNCAYFITDKPEQLKFFPPFIAGVNLNNNTLLGAENYYIAQALAAGKGFSNPFQVETGATAWMPPLYPLLLALLIKIFQSKALVAICVVFFKDLVLIFSGLVVYEIAKRTFMCINPAVSLAIYMLFLLGSFRSFFQITHDCWLVLLLLCIIFILAAHIRSNNISVTLASIWGMVGGLAILSNPILGLVWFVLCLLILREKKFKMLLISILLFLSISSVWVVRNYVVFKRIIFIKSNVFYDAYHINYEKADGLPDEEFEKLHPVWHAKYDPQSPYGKLGEVTFLENYREKFFTEIKNNPMQFLRNIKNRFLAALLLYYPYNHYEKKFILFYSIIHPLPFIGLLLIILCKSTSLSKYFSTALLIYILYLVPYIIISYHIRYGLPLTPLKVLFCGWGADLVFFNMRQDSRPVMS
jgi:hypothetical protein